MRAASLLSLVALLSCGGPAQPVVDGPARCARPPGLATATGCALLSGRVTGPAGQGLEGLEGSIRPSAGCSCQGVTLQIDERGLFSATVYRLAAAGSPPGPDSGTVTVVVLATDPRYPRHVTGAPYFDTLAVTVPFAALGGAPEPREVRLRIPLP